MISWHYALALILVVSVASGKTALLIVDVQDCFLEANTTTGKPGSLAVPASHIIPLINQVRAEKSCLFDHVIFSQDYHPANHISFASSHGLDPFSHLGGLGGLLLMCLTPTSGSTADASCCPKIHVAPDSVNRSTTLSPPVGWNYTVNMSILVTGNTACSVCKDTPQKCFESEQMMWTDHCEQSGDSTFPPSLDKRAGDLIVQKGVNKHVDAYSAFMDNTATLKTQLDADLQAKGITELFVVGIATDVCVKWTVKDAIGGNTGSYVVTVIKDATAAVQGDQNNYNSAIAFMEAEGATVVLAADVLAMVCPVAVTTPAPTPTKNGTLTPANTAAANPVKATYTLPAVFFALVSLISI